MSMDLARKTFSCEPEYFIAGTNIRIATAVKEAGADLSAHTPVLLAEGKVTPVAEAAKLTGKDQLSKGFLVEFKSGHVGMVQRIVGTGRSHYTVRSGAPSTSDKMQTMGSPSAAAMHSTIWPEVEPEVELFLAAKLTERAEQVLARAKRKA